MCWAPSCVSCLRAAQQPPHHPDIGYPIGWRRVDPAPSPCIASGLQGYGRPRCATRPPANRLNETAGTSGGAKRRQSVPCFVVEYGAASEHGHLQCSLRSKNGWVSHLMERSPRLFSYWAELTRVETSCSGSFGNQLLLDAHHCPAATAGS